MDPSVAIPGEAWWELAALEYASLFYEEHDDLAPGLAQAIRNRAFDPTEAALQGDSENTALLGHLAQALFHALSDDRAAFVEVSDIAPEAYVNQWTVMWLAGAHARRGDVDEAAELLLRYVRRGQLFNRSGQLELLAPAFVRSQEYGRFLEADARLEQQLRERYAQ